jgi:1-phosphatidylinositol phosphodiesterase
MALGNGSVTRGINQRLVSFLKKQKGRRAGIVMFDFFDKPSELMDTFLGL